MDKKSLDILKKSIDRKEWKEYEDKNPLWKDAHSISEDILNLALTLDEAVGNILTLGLKFLKVAKDNDEVKEVLIFFDSLRDMLFSVYGDDAVHLCEDEPEGRLLAQFDTHDLGPEFKQEIARLIQELEQYFEKKK